MAARVGLGSKPRRQTRESRPARELRRLRDIEHLRTYIVNVPEIHLTEYQVLAASKRSACEMVRLDDSSVVRLGSRLIKRTGRRWTVEREGTMG